MPESIGAMRMRLFVSGLIRWKLMWLALDVAVYSATGQVTSDSFRCPCQVGRAAMARTPCSGKRTPGRHRRSDAGSAFRTRTKSRLWTRPPSGCVTDGVQRKNNNEPGPSEEPCPIGRATSGSTPTPAREPRPAPPPLGRPDRPRAWARDPAPSTPAPTATPSAPTAAPIRSTAPWPSRPARWRANNRADLTNTSPTTPMGPFPQWTDASKIVSLDPWGARVAEDFADEIRDGVDIRLTIAVTTRPRASWAEINEAIARRPHSRPTATSSTTAAASPVTKAAIDPVWWLPGDRRAVRRLRDGAAPHPVRDRPAACTPTWSPGPTSRSSCPRSAGITPLHLRRPAAISRSERAA